MRIEILGPPFNGLGTFPDIENPAEGLRQANLMSLLEASGHIVTDYGIRDWDHIGASNIAVYDRRRMIKNGIKHTVQEGLKNFYQKELPVWLHFDVDVLDPELMPVMFPVPEGLTFEEAQEFLGFGWASGQVIGMSITCYHPKLDIDGSAGAQLVTLVSEVLSSPS